MTKGFHLDANKEPSVIILHTSTKDDEVDERIAIHTTHEGIIMDFYSNHALTGSIRKTYEEWFELAQ
jgi:hypothetical protein